MRKSMQVLGGLLFVMLAVGCPKKAATPSTTGTTDAGQVQDAGQVDAGPVDAGPPDPGALVQVTMHSTVGVLLDELPSDLRDRVATRLIERAPSFWEARARTQIRLTALHLIFRAGYYPDDNKQQLPLPPESVWQVRFEQADGTQSTPHRATVGGHDLVTVDYAFTTTLLSDLDSPGVSEPALATVGGTWSEPFSFPVDPEMVLQRTGYACMNEAEFPPNSVDSEEVDSFYDQDCDVEAEPSNTGCHQADLPQRSCLTALDEEIGRVDTTLEFARVPWNAALADQVRVGPLTNASGADLQGVTEEIRQHRIIYRYIAPDSCSIVEGCVGGSGWRRLLQFTAADRNTGTQPVNIGEVDYFVDQDGGTELAQHNIFEYSACHHHYHFSHYANFSFNGSAQSTKRGFCLQSTNRYSNLESSPLHNPYGDCTYQGIEAGWGDEYKAGLECQWVDVTGFDTSAAPFSGELQLSTNPDGFLCEGQPVLDAQGNLEFEPTSFTTADGGRVDRPKCNFMNGWDANNKDSYQVVLPVSGQGYVTGPCERGQLGPKRNCGFTPPASVSTCTPGATVSLHCSVGTGAQPQVVRICEASAVLGAGTACTFNDALGNSPVLTGADGGALTFTCPAARDATEPGGRYALYTAPLFDEDPASPVTCTAN